ncbi:MAG: hypothetical protein V2A66_00025, partial [Pseudomonadota bacterium]
DDRASSYSTGRGSGGPAQLYAHADPVMLVGYDKKTVWSETGGTSSAQPHLSAAILLMKEVNPALSADDCMGIIERTADPSAGDANVRIIDPMEALVVAAHLPGSTYQGDRLNSFTRALGFKADGTR